MQGCAIHSLQLFDTPESRGASVAEFLSAGFHAGETLLVVARQRNWRLIEAALDLHDCPVSALMHEQRLVLLDAEELLEEISRRDVPQRDRFEAIVGELVSRLAKNGPLRVYGEMVELLAERDNMEAAVRLEGFWNELGGRHAFNLLCGYSAAHFAGVGGDGHLRRVSAAHGHADARPEDTLGCWLLNVPVSA